MGYVILGDTAAPVAPDYSVCDNPNTTIYQQMPCRAQVLINFNNKKEALQQAANQHFINCGLEFQTGAKQNWPIIKDCFDPNLYNGQSLDAAWLQDIANVRRRLIDVLKTRNGPGDIEKIQQLQNGTLHFIIIDNGIYDKNKPIVINDPDGKSSGTYYAFTNAVDPKWKTPPLSVKPWNWNVSWFGYYGPATNNTLQFIQQGYKSQDLGFSDLLPFEGKPLTVVTTLIDAIACNPASELAARMAAGTNPGAWQAYQTACNLLGGGPKQVTPVQTGISDTLKYAAIGGAVLIGFLLITMPPKRK